MTNFEEGKKGQRGLVSESGQPTPCVRFNSCASNSGLFLNRNVPDCHGPQLLLLTVAPYHPLGSLISKSIRTCKLYLSYALSFA